MQLHDKDLQNLETSLRELKESDGYKQQDADTMVQAEVWEAMSQKQFERARHQRRALGQTIEAINDVLDEMRYAEDELEKVVDDREEEDME